MKHKFKIGEVCVYNRHQNNRGLVVVEGFSGQFIIVQFLKYNYHYKTNAFETDLMTISEMIMQYWKEFHYFKTSFPSWASWKDRRLI